jgi:hypothetical protein
MPCGGVIRQRRGPHSSARRIGFASRHVGRVRTCARLAPLLKAVRDRCDQ